MSKKRKQKRLLVGIPMHQGEVTAATAQTVGALFSKDNHWIRTQYLGLSLLARNFNSMWLNAWNQGFDYFVLLHADIGVETPETLPGSWVDYLVDTVDRLEAAVVSAVSPIKSFAGHTSLAIQLDPQNPYGLRRATLQQIQQLPGPFITRKDLCQTMGLDINISGAMLINTGCMIMNLRHPKFDWRKWPGFSITDSIAFNKKGIAKPFTVPEDWALSMWLYNMGWPYYATKKLVVHHFGHIDYASNSAIGQPSDTTPVDPTIEEWEQSD